MTWHDMTWHCRAGQGRTGHPWTTLSQTTPSQDTSSEDHPFAGLRIISCFFSVVQSTFLFFVPFLGVVSLIFLVVFEDHRPSREGRPLGFHKMTEGDQNLHHETTPDKVRNSDIWNGRHKKTVRNFGSPPFWTAQRSPCPRPSPSLDRLSPHTPPETAPGGVNPEAQHCLEFGVCHSPRILLPRLPLPPHLSQTRLEVSRHP